jgi:hypothetical protein
MKISSLTVFLGVSLFASFVSCENKELFYGYTDGREVDIVIHWPSDVDGPAHGMRTNLFALQSSPKYGISDMSKDGGRLKLPEGASYMALAYDYFGSKNIYFRNETDAEKIEAYCAPLVRAGYSRAFPDENTVAEPDPFYVDKVAVFNVTKSDTTLIMNFYPENVLKRYTFIIRGISGAQHISATRGALSGMSASYFLATETPATTPATILFNAVADGANDCITGSFLTFGRLPETNNFTIEILYPSATESVITKTWDVTDQMSIDNHFEIVIDNADITVIPYAGGGGSGFEATVKEWENEVIPVGM